ncbi:hypothetical protein FOVSG1_004915 [Fusarium oxysporum f. sp. vasinfectum]
MDIVGHVIDPRESQRFQKGDLIMSTGTIESEIPVLGLSTLPFSLCTAACGLYLRMGLAKVADISDATATHVLIWGAKGGIGKLAIQLAKISG